MPSVLLDVGILVTEARAIEGAGGQIADLYERHVPAAGGNFRYGTQDAAAYDECRGGWPELKQ
jgi:hypothetical protein